jgi:uncharacterized protein
VILADSNLTSINFTGSNFKPMNDCANSETLNTQLSQLLAWAGSLLVYRNILTHRASQACIKLLSLLTQPDAHEAAVLNAYGEWFYAIAPFSSWQAWIEQQIVTAENSFTQSLQHHSLSELSPTLVAAAQHDLKMLQHWAMEGPSLIHAAVELKTELKLPTLGQYVTEDERSHLVLPFYFSGYSRWAEILPALADRYRWNGVGVFAQSLALRWRNQTLEAIEHPEQIQMADLMGYDWQQTALKQNTEALLSGHAALNVLLYGSRGSGKSALVKALLTEYGDCGLRLIELSKADMINLPQVVEQLRTSSLKFVIFVDDLSFEEDEESYKALKVVLEGTLTARPQNVVVYATSNRRHLIREFFGDRPRMSDADEVHTWDTVQEKLSLSDRFGLTLTFEPADQDTYLQIVRGYAQRFAIIISEEDLTHQALQWAVRHNVRSGRTARQFMDHLRAQLAN